MADTKAITKAKEVLNDNYVIGPPVDVYEIARNYDIDVNEARFPEAYKHISGFITPKDNRATMYVNETDAEPRRKFTVAHELGHWLLHKNEILSDPSKSVLYRIALGKLNDDPMEREANAFAAELLVPMEFFKKMEKGRSQDELAKTFGVSAEVIGYRKKNLRHVRPKAQV